MFKKKIAIIGGGPNSVYATEILLKKILKKKPKEKIKIFFFDKFGNFGFGNTHNIKLEKKILLNRIAHQISLGSNPFIKFPNNNSVLSSAFCCRYNATPPANKGLDIEVPVNFR